MPRKVTCFLCGGTTKIDCQSCSGTGKVFDRSTGKYQNCYRCTASSVEYAGEPGKLRCSECGGQGFWYKETARDRRALASQRNGGCFIVTAACGNATSPEVVYLSSFRDQVLNRSLPGQVVVQFYYRASPHLAAVISGSRVLQLIVRYTLVRPLVAILQLSQQRATGHRDGRGG